ncbi:MAG: hypothetical protein ACE5IW_11200 [bacterium]
MPVKPIVQTKPISYDDFHSVDYEAFHNSFAQDRFAFLGDT